MLFMSQLNSRSIGSRYVVFLYNIYVRVINGVMCIISHFGVFSVIKA